jgi:plastocyanin
MRRRPTLWLVLGAVAIVGGACSGGGNDNPVSGGSTPPSSTSTSAITGCQGIPGLSGSVADHGRAKATGAQLSLEAGDSFFAPTCLDDVAEGTVSLVVRNTGSALHNVSIPDQGIDSDVPAGETITVSVKVDRDPVAFFCKYHRTSGMVGALLPSGA